MNLELQPSGPAEAPVRQAIPLPWRDPHTVPPERLALHIVRLKQACAEQPHSADLWTCLGMAHAMNFDAYQSMDALEQARQANPNHFWAQVKYAELLYRLRALPKAEQETLHALDLAGSVVEFSIARRQLQEIRRLMREGTQKPAWTKSLAWPAAILLVLTGLAGWIQPWL